MVTKVLLDTDIGTDIDDAVCLAYLLAQRDCELMGITTVTGEAEKRAMLASVLCTVAGKAIPIFPGAEQPLVVPQLQKVATQAVVLPNWDHETRFPRGEAVEFLRSTIRRFPREITLLTIAPLTNIGLLFSVDPEIPSLLKGIVMMCGRFGGPVNGEYGPLEWNACGDPHATAIVYGAGVPIHRSCGLDVTSWVTMDVLDMAEVWFKEWGGVTFHDPLAAATIFDETICTFRRGTVSIELGDAESAGKTSWSENAAEPRHEIAVEVNNDRFFRHYRSLFIKKGSGIEQ
ncbi:MAG: nucleoside hydrolase [Ignavibacteria bacterium]|nr:MAG: nucleoside hydrolase [Ignavibacteria bacterium]